MKNKIPIGRFCKKSSIRNTHIYYYFIEVIIIQVRPSVVARSNDCCLTSSMRDNNNSGSGIATPFRAPEFTCFLRCSSWSTFCVLSSGFVNHCLSLCPLFGHCIVCPSFSLDYPLTNVDDRLYMVDDRL